jgi:hypothetical protein
MQFLSSHKHYHAVLHKTDGLDVLYYILVPVVAEKIIHGHVLGNYL